MKLCLISIIFCLSYTYVSGNWFLDFAKGVQEGIEDAYRKGEKNLDSVKDKMKEKIGSLPKSDLHRIKLHKLIKKAGHDVEKWHKKFFKKFGLTEDKKSKRKFHQQWKMINKWMKTLTKNDTDGDKQHHVPFIPHIFVKNEKEKQDKRSKAEKIFKKFAKMWDEETKAKLDNDFKKKVQLLGYDEKKIEPKFEKGWEDLKQNSEKKLPLFEEEKTAPFDQKNAEPFNSELAFGIGEKVSEEVDKKSKSFEKKAEKLFPSLNVKEEKLEHLMKGDIKPITQDELIKEAKASAENWGKKADSLLLTKFADTPEKKASPAEKDLSVEKFDGLGATAMKNVENMMKTKKVFDSFQKEASKNKDFADAEKKIAREQKLFEEAEKEWEKAMLKKTEETKAAEIEKTAPELTTEQKEVEEELKEPADNVFTPPEEEEIGKVNPTTKPFFFFKFDKEENLKDKKFPEKKEEHLPTVPKRIVEPASIFPGKKPEHGFVKMREEIKPFFRQVDDEEFRKKALAEEEEWNKLKKFFQNKLFKAGLKLANEKKKGANKKKSIFKEPRGYITE